jgi:hypothetical protein
MGGCILRRIAERGVAGNAKWRAGKESRKYEVGSRKRSRRGQRTEDGGRALEEGSVCDSRHFARGLLYSRWGLKPRQRSCGDKGVPKCNPPRRAGFGNEEHKSDDSGSGGRFEAGGRKSDVGGVAKAVRNAWASYSDMLRAASHIPGTALARSCAACNLTSSLAYR